MEAYGITLNYLAIVVAAVVTFAFGMVWYNPMLFGKQWMAAHAYSPEQIAAMQREMPKTYGISFVTYLIMSAGVAIFSGFLHIARWQGGVKLGALIWLVFVATTGLTMNLFSGKKLATWMIDAGYQLVCLVAMGAILALWH